MTINITVNGMGKLILNLYEYNEFILVYMNFIFYNLKLVKILILITMKLTYLDHFSSNLKL